MFLPFFQIPFSILNMTQAMAVGATDTQHHGQVTWSRKGGGDARPYSFGEDVAMSMQCLYLVTDLSYTMSSGGMRIIRDLNAWKNTYM